MPHLRRATLVLLFSCAPLATIGGAGLAACTDEEHTVRTRPEAGDDAEAGSDASDAGPNALSCGVPVPPTYDSPAYTTNAKAELDLRARYDELAAKMGTAEGAGTAVVTAAELQTIFTAGAPSLRSIATAAAQATVDGYLTAFGDAVGKTWSPLDAEDGGAGAPTGGKYEAGALVSPAGLELREAVAKTLLGGSFYNHALALAAGPITEATVDQLLALFGATPALANRVDGPDADTLAAALASQRDNKAAASGTYRRVANALLRARTAARAGASCRADLDVALQLYFAEWEKATYFTVIYALNQGATSAAAVPPKGAAALHAFAGAIGLAQSFRGIPQDRRRITDVQIDALLTRVGAPAPYQLVTRTSERTVAFNTAYQDVGAIFGLTQTEIEDSKKSY